MLGKRGDSTCIRSRPRKIMTVNVLAAEADEQCSRNHLSRVDDHGTCHHSSRLRAAGKCATRQPSELTQFHADHATPA